MIYILCAVTALYALLSMVAALTQMKTAGRKDASLLDAPILMFVGGVLLVAAVLFVPFGLANGWLVAAVGGAAICVAAFLNGKRSGKFHIRHHIIRFTVTVLLVLGLSFLS